MKRELLFSTLCAALSTGAFSAFAAEGYTDTPMQPNGKWHIHDPNRPQPPIATPGKQFSQMADAPADAVILFDGKDFSKWQGQKDAKKNPNGDVMWKIQDN